MIGFQQHSFKGVQQKIFTCLFSGISVVQDPLCTVAKVLESSYFEQRLDINKISIQASNEATLEGMLQKVRAISNFLQISTISNLFQTSKIVKSGHL